jgi:hypothetical protein
MAIASQIFAYKEPEDTPQTQLRHTSKNSNGPESIAGSPLLVGWSDYKKEEN